MLGAYLLPDVIGLLSKEFIIMVGIAIVIATPVAWWAMNVWLQDFAYRINISWWVFVMAGVAAIIIALITVQFSGNKSCSGQPGKELENRIVFFLLFPD